MDLAGNQWPEDVHKGEGLEVGKSAPLEAMEYGAFATEDEGSDIVIYSETVNNKGQKNWKKYKDPNKAKKKRIKEIGVHGEEFSYTENSDRDKPTPSELETKKMLDGIYDIGEHEFYEDK